MFINTDYKVKIYHSLKEVQADLASNVISCVDLTNSYLQRIKEQKHLNVFVEVFEDSAIASAKRVDEQLKAGKAGKLAGMVIAIKDNICYSGHKVSAASKMLEGFESLYSATVVERLLDEGAVIIGRCNCDEFAMGSSNENSSLGNVLNPIDNDYVPGGSSGGSAAAVAANLCLVALGTDTGGSIRQPASFCGIVGLKPSYGRVSRYGAIAYASSFDQIGPLSKNVEDAALVMEVMAGHDEYDSTASPAPVGSYASVLSEAPKKYKIAYLDGCLNHEGLDSEVGSQVKTALENMKKEGHSVDPVTFSYLDYLVPTYYILTTAEASSNLSRYDGVHYGYRSDKAVDIESVYKDSRSEGFGDEVKRRIMLGTFVLSAGYYDAYYSKAQRMRRLIVEETSRILKEYDFVVLPTTPSTAFKIGQKSDDPMAMYLEDIFTVQANITGFPAISLPVGKHSNGMPFGIQVMGKMMADDKLLAFSKQLGY